MKALSDEVCPNTYIAQQMGQPILVLEIYINILASNDTIPPPEPSMAILVYYSLELGNTPCAAIQNGWPQSDFLQGSCYILILLIAVDICEAAV